MKESTIKLVSGRLEDLRSRHKVLTAQLKNHSDYVAKLTAELHLINDQTAELEADLQASNIAVTEVAERAAFERSKLARVTAERIAARDRIRQLQERLKSKS